MRSLFVLALLLVTTPIYALRVLMASWRGLPNTEGSAYRTAPRRWSGLVCRAAGVRVFGHGLERLSDGQARILVANHVSWFDVFALAATLPQYTFVAKAELARIPFFGPAARAAGQLFIERQNRKAAFAAYEQAAERIRDGTMVVVFPEGTRASSYALRPFKKGPFVLAIAAGAPIVPVLIHGTFEVLPKGSWRIRPHDVHLHVLGDIPTAGMTYEDRDRLARQVYEALRGAQRTLYHVESPEWAPPRAAAPAPTP